MSTSESFRSRLAKRILALITVALPMGVMVSQGCNPYSGCSDKAINESRCFNWPANEGGAGGTGGMGGGVAGAAGMGGSAGAGGMGGGAPVMCPAPGDAKPILDANNFTPVTIMRDGVLKNGQCCYDVQYVSPCLGGRPFLVDETPRTALVERQAHGGRWTDTALAKPSVLALNDDERAELAAVWARDGLFEHASVASFGRFALELMAVGAPAELVAAAHEAALDEVRHARLCLSLASAFAGHVIEPGTFPFDGRVIVSADLVEIASRVALEGAIGETIAAVTAAEQFANAEDPAVRAVLAVIAEDEARHAELAFRTLVWAIQVGGEPVAASVARTFVGALHAFAPPVSTTRASFEAFGRLGDAALRRATNCAINEVLKPAIEALGLGGQGRFTHATIGLS